MKLRNYLAVSLCLLALSGCSSNSQETAATAAAAIQQTTAAETTAAQSADKTASPFAADLESLMDLLGKTDFEVTAVLGRGEETKNGEGLILERTYTLSLLGEDAYVSLIFNLYQEGSDLLEQAVIHLGKSDLKEYASALTQLFGEPTETYEKSYFFTSGNKTLVLADPYGDGAYIEISVD